MDFSELIVPIVSRWLHILAAVTAVGGTIFTRLALMPAAGQLPDSERATLAEGIRSRWMKAVMLSILFLLASGLYNFIAVLPGLKETDIKPLYHALFGTKVLLALGIFFIASALVGRSPALQKMRDNARFWVTLNMVLAIALVCISGFLRVVRDDALSRL